VVTNDYDTFGNTIRHFVSSSNVFRLVLATDDTHYTYAQDAGAWLNSQLRSMTSHSVGPNGEVGVDRLQTYETYSTSGLVRLTHVEPTSGASMSVSTSRPSSTRKGTPAQ